MNKNKFNFKNIILFLALICTCIFTIISTSATSNTKYKKQIVLEDLLDLDTTYHIASNLDGTPISKNTNYSITFDGLSATVNKNEFSYVYFTKLFITSTNETLNKDFVYSPDVSELIYEIVAEENGFCTLKPFSSIDIFNATSDGYEIKEIISPLSNESIVRIIEKDNVNQLHSSFSISFDTPFYANASYWYLKSYMQYSDGTEMYDFIHLDPNCVTINFFYKESYDGNYLLKDTRIVPLNATGIIPPDIPDNEDSVFIGWDKPIDTSLPKTIDIYALYGRKTKIIVQPKNTEITYLDNANFDITAIGEELKYEWRIGKKVTSDIPIEPRDLVNFTFLNGYYTSTNHDDNSTASFTFGPFTVDEDVADFKYKIKASTEDGWDEVKVSVQGVDNSYSNTAYYSGMYDFMQQAHTIKKGTYVMTITYVKDDDGSDLEDTVYIGDFTLNDKPMTTKQTILDEAQLFGGNSTTAQYPGSNLTDKFDVQCTVIGKYGTVLSDIVTITLKDPVDVEFFLLNDNNVPHDSTSFNNLTSVGFGKIYKQTPIINDEVKVNENIAKAPNYTAPANHELHWFSCLSQDNKYIVVGELIDLKEVISLSAKYTGPDIFTNKNYDENNVEIIATLRDGSKINVKFDELDEKVSKLVVNTEYNEYPVKYKGKTASFFVWGYKIDHIDAEYIGDDIYVGKDYDGKDVKVTIFYTKSSDGTFKNIPADSFKLNSLTVTKTEDNKFFASIDEYKDDFSVWGYKFVKLDAKYNGPDILVDNYFKRVDVYVEVTSSPFSDGTLLKLPVTDFSIEDTKVLKIGNNDYIVKYKDLEDTIHVNGYKESFITAEYLGDKILVSHEYAKKDVKVILHYASYETGKMEEKILEEFSLDSLVVKLEGDNEFTATYKNMSAKFKVPGYKLSPAPTPTPEPAPTPEPPTTAPQTSDNSNFLLFSSLAIYSLISLFILLRKKRKIINF